MPRMERNLNLFEQYLKEAPDDTPPDIPADTGPPDMPDDVTTDDGPPDLPPDMPDDQDQPQQDDGPPDMGDGFGEDDQGQFDGSDDIGADEQPAENLELDEKISNVMNRALYQRFLSLLNTISTQLSMIKANSDVLYTITTSSVDVLGKLKKLDDNVRYYLKEDYPNENYSKNLLFFNKCLNLLKLLNDVLDKNVRKGIKALK